MWVINSSVMRLAGHVAVLGGAEVHRGYPCGELRKRLLESPRRRWKYIIQMCFLTDVWIMDWSDLVQDRNRCRALVNAVMNIRVS
jgi:hypothetical protein